MADPTSPHRGTSGRWNVPLAVSHPGLAAQVSPDSAVAPDTVTAGSSATLLWRCPTEGHADWQAPVRRRVCLGQGCPTCAGKRPAAGVNDLATTHPDLVAQLHPDNPVTADDLTAGSSRKLLWACPTRADHPAWSAAVSSRVAGQGCPVCANKRIVAGINDLATTHPALAAQIDPTSPVAATAVTAGTAKKALWRCPDDPAHTWTATVVSRAHNGAGCPACWAERKAAGNKARALPGPGQSLAETFPDIAATLDPGSDFTAEGVRPRSDRRGMWVCPAHGTWPARVADRTAGQGCPGCKADALRRRRSTPGKGQSLADLMPDLAAEIDDSSPVKAADVKPGSQREAVWRCPEHGTWPAQVKARAKHGSGCPVCANKKVLAGANDLATTHPDIASQVAQASPVRPDEVSYGAKTALLWSCLAAGDHPDWWAPVCERTAGAGCPACWGERRAEGIRRRAAPDEGASLADVFPGLAATLDPDSDFTADAVRPRSGRKGIWTCPEHGQWLAPVIARAYGRGCPACADSGFDPSRAGYLYLIAGVLAAEQTSVLKVGITNNLEVRLASHGWARRRVDVLRSDTGADVRDWEAQLKQGLARAGVRTLRDKGYVKFDGYSEAWERCDLDADSLDHLAHQLGVNTAGLPTLRPHPGPDAPARAA